MSLTGFLKRTLFFKKNKTIKEFYNEIKFINGLRGSEFADKKLKEIKQYAIDHTKFYANYSIDDKFPVMTKMDFINNYEDILSDERFDFPLHISSTSGSTGIPFSVKQDDIKRKRTIADLKVYGEYAKYPSHERMLQLRAYNGKPLDRLIDKKENIFRYDISNLSSYGIEKLIDYIYEIKPTIIFGYVSTLEMIAEYIIQSKKNYNFNLKSVLVGAETLTDTAFEKINKVFKCPVYDRYSNMEMGIYAQREYGKTKFIINKASYYFEILKIDSDEPAEEHEIGRILFTDLYNHAFPMIRYDTGDLGAFCYNGVDKEIEIVYGRKVDCIYSTDGSLIDPHVISRKMSSAQNIKQWQFIQCSEKEYKIKINKKGEINEQGLIEIFKKILGLNASLKIEYVEDIPVMNSQKRKYIINEMIKQK